MFSPKSKNAAAPCLVAMVLAFFIVSAGAQNAELRTWTSADGRTIQAKLIRLENDQAVFELTDGSSAKVPLSRLIADDQAFARQNAASARLDAGKRAWPDVVEISGRAVDVKMVEENPEKRSYVYRSEFFQFTSQDKLAVSVMKEIARTFEATHALVSALPRGIKPTPPKDLGYYQAKFYLNRRNYVLDGAPENSGGVYSSRDRTFKIPFESLGLTMRGKTWFKDEGYQNGTIVHEITHQMMHDYLFYLPIWIIEGTAEYTEMLPFNAGKFLASSHERGLKEYIREANSRGIVPTDIGEALKHMQMSQDTWTDLALTSNREQIRLYYASCLLVYYFSHLDGDGSGANFLKYLDSIGEARDAWQTFFNNPAVKPNSSGGFTYPTSLKLPTQPRDEAYGIAQLSILLQGRNAEQLDADVKAGFRKIGIKW